MNSSNRKVAYDNILNIV